MSKFSKDLLSRLAGKVRTGDEESQGDAASASLDGKPAATGARSAASESGVSANATLEELLQRVNSLVASPAQEPAHAAPPAPAAPQGAAIASHAARSAPMARPPLTPPQASPAFAPSGFATAKAPDSGAALAAVSTEPPNLAEEFVPREPVSFEASGSTESEVEALILKFLLARGDATGRTIAGQIRLPFVLIDELLRGMKRDQLVVYKNSAEMGDYVYQLTEMGRERARRLAAYCTYFGAAPVSIEDYIASIKAQSIERQRPTKDDLERAFSDLLINTKMLGRLGPAINSGRGMFLFGAPGNGKTSIAERVTRCFGETIWIPRAIGADGEIIRLYDPNAHIEAPLQASEGLLDRSKIDRRWVRIRRPTIIVGGELTMENLEIQYNRTTGISEASMQLKSNCGTLVIDDFGRQRMRTDELLNRWIVPLEKRYDFLNLANGKKLEVPFDQLVIFSTNLQPKDLVDDAFLRRIPYKIEVLDPTEEEFRSLFRLMCPKLGFEHNLEAIDYLIERHYKPIRRPFRCCQPRDLLMQVRSHCMYENKPLALTREHFDFAVENYFAIM